MEASLILLGMVILITGIYNLMMKKRVLRGFVFGLLGIGVIFTGASYMTGMVVKDEDSGYFKESKETKVAAKEEIEDTQREKQQKKVHEKQVKEAQKKKKQFELEKKRLEEANQPSPYSAFIMAHGERVGLEIAEMAEHLLSYEATPKWNKNVKQTEKEIATLIKEIKDFKDIPEEHKDLHKEYIESLLAFQKPIEKFPEILAKDNWKEMRKLQMDIQEANKGIDQVHVKMVEAGIK